MTPAGASWSFAATRQAGPTVPRPVAAQLARPLTLCLATLAVLGAAAPPAGASPGSSTTAIVSLGDSFSSGQAGRWQGNSNDPTADRAGTDRSCVRTLTGCRYEIGNVYLGGTAPPGCARSDIAEIHSARIRVGQKINIACSGAETSAIPRAASGGRAFKGEAPQADQLARIARDRNLKLILLSISGNDIGFASIVADCVVAYVSRAGSCVAEQRRRVNAKLPAAMAGVARSIDDIRAVMRSAGYRPWDYRLVLQSYPSPFPRAAEVRYGETDSRRSLVGGCPLYDVDLDDARDTLVPRLDSELRKVALPRGVQFLSLKDVLQGREVCAKSTRLVDASSPPSPVTSEWARFISLSAIFQGVTIEEEAHPSAFGQRALGDCLSKLYARSTGSWACRNTPGRGTDAMVLARVSSVPGRFAMHLRAAPRRVRAGRRCFRFRVLSGGEPVGDATVRLARRRGRTRRDGRVRVCARLRARSYRARASRPGFRPVSVRISARRPGRR